MKVLVIPDIHLKSWIFDMAEERLTNPGEYSASDIELLSEMDIPVRFSPCKQIFRIIENRLPNRML